MSRAVVGLTRDMLAQLPVAQRACVHWELDPMSRSAPLSPAQRCAAKDEWLATVLLQWGSCGQVLMVDGRAVGYLAYAPPHLVPSAASSPTAPISEDAVLLTTGWVQPEFRRSGHGRLLTQAVLKDLLRRRIRAVEAFASVLTTSCLTHDDAESPHDPCLLPAAFLGAVGFRTVRPHPSVPRLRLDVRATAAWRTEVEHAVDRLLGSLRAPVPNVG